ncbi:hypothetical protein TNCV_2339121 [Trichonephila clavipes]|nr:hypothetical protein TNCV_2339121 [Trichonephila clavipes]
MTRCLREKCLGPPDGEHRFPISTPRYLQADFITPFKGRFENLRKPPPQNYRWKINPLQYVPDYPQITAQLLTYSATALGHKGTNTNRPNSTNRCICMALCRCRPVLRRGLPSDRSHRHKSFIGFQS